LPDTEARLATPLTRVTIDRLGRRGEGVAETETGRIYVPYALPGEFVSVDREGDRATLVGLLTPSADRRDAFCRYFTTCGGCVVQTLAWTPYAEWKRNLLVEALSRAGIDALVDPLVDAHGAGRRRATFHARIEDDVRARVGFMQARAHTIVPIEACPILDPRLDGALPAARGVAAALSLAKKPLDIVATATESGLDLDLRGHGPLSKNDQDRLTAVALSHGLARLSNHGVIVVESRKPRLRIGAALVDPPPGTFLQATDAGEEALASRVCAALDGAKRIADLFSGLGTFALRLAETAEVKAYDTEGPALAALDRAARATPGLRPIAIETRDLFRRPLVTEELNAFDAIVLDPPRAGADAQMRAIAASRIARVASVACDVQTFARDAAILVAAGFTLERVVPIDQFKYSAHVEIFASFKREPAKKKRRLLG
jgi:23S rRNA (uracil1939-C5)-methyltransferase